jgi:hypothetical protein
MILGRPPYCQSRITALWNACSGRTIECVEEIFANKGKDKIGKTYTTDLLEFMKTILIPDPDKRPCADDLLAVWRGGRKGRGQRDLGSKRQQSFGVANFFIDHFSRTLL